MCGIAGYYNPEMTSDMAIARRVTEMTQAIAHRGPDDEGLWMDASLGIGLGHRRLSIQDLSPAGHQPMVSQDGRWVMVYNGDTYIPEVRASLEQKGHVFRGHSDTEVMLEAIAQKGVAEACQLFIGKFAFAVWDRKDRRLYLARDRVGIKPLYWGKIGRSFFFASELKSFHTLPEFQPVIDQEALSAYLRYGYVPTPLSIFKGIQKIEPGHILVYQEGKEPEETPYWTLIDQIAKGRQAPYTKSYEDSLLHLDDLLGDAVKRRLTADVPVGTLLSGGIDSSLVTALAQKWSLHSVKTFSIGFEDKAYDEAPFARDIAKHLNTDHTELYVSAQQARDVIPLLPRIYDEPFADSSQIPTFLVCQLAQKSVTVGLTGDGGDEVFAGYNRYTWANRAWEMNQKMPLKSLLCSALRHFPYSLLTQLLSCIPASKRPQSLLQKLPILEPILMAHSLQDIYMHLVSQWQDPEKLIQGFKGSKKTELPTFKDLGVTDPVEQMQLMDTLTYMMDDVLVKVDRASMAVPLMTRTPLLDHRVIEWAWKLPLEFKLQGKTKKRILKDLLYKYVPQDLVDRPKRGFGIPIGAWLREDLRDWAESLLAPEALSDLLDPKPIQDIWKQHKKGGHHDGKLWTILMLQAWRESEKN